MALLQALRHLQLDDRWAGAWRTLPENLAAWYRTKRLVSPEA